jgi:hypothetical protein
MGPECAPTNFFFVQLDLSSSKLGTLIKSVTSFQSDVEGVVARAFAEALVGAFNFATEKLCMAFVNAGGCIWTEGHPDERTYCANCVVSGDSTATLESVDGLAEASASKLTGSLNCMPKMPGKSTVWP